MALVCFFHCQTSCSGPKGEEASANGGCIFLQLTLEAQRRQVTPTHGFLLRMNVFVKVGSQRQCKDMEDKEDIKDKEDIIDKEDSSTSPFPQLETRCAWTRHGAGSILGHLPFGERLSNGGK